MIEIVIDAATVRVPPGIDAGTLTTVLRAGRAADMIAVPAGMRVLVATKPVDFRRGADSLAALVRVYCGPVFDTLQALLLAARTEPDAAIAEHDQAMS
jgi:hypothetical protein